MKAVKLAITQLFLFTAISGVAQVTFSGVAEKVIIEQPVASTGLDAVYVLDHTAGVVVSYISEDGNRPVWLSYSNLGGGFAEQVADVSYSGSTSTITLSEGDCGYIIEDGTTRRYFYVIDYSAHPYDVRSIRPSEQQDCGQIALDVDGSAPAITYYSINGRSVELDRGISLTYSTMKLDEATKTYTITSTEVAFEHLSAVIHAPAPLCRTDFTLWGDRFLREWGREQVVATETVFPQAVEAYSSATQASRDNANENNAQADGLGGSAPAEVEFYAAVTDGAVFTEWQFSTYPDFDDIQLRISDPVTTYTFREQGTTYVRFMCANDAGTCDYYSNTYEVSIGASTLLCPNAFSPGASEGVNDEWKVSYSSIVEFECHIFNRLGVQMAEFTDPSQGWDGKYNGKLVPAGVYYYVIRARGADGKDYKLSGDINIVGYR